MTKEPQKILVTGFAHCGTTILRAKIADCKFVIDQPLEFGDPPQTGQTYVENAKWYVWKHPFLHTQFRDKGFQSKKDSWLNNIIVVPIIRNPWYAFTSILKRIDNKYNPTDGLSLNYYFNAAERILDAFQNNYEGVYPIRYEDMFENDFEKLKTLFDKIGLEYDDEIFLNRQRDYKFNNADFDPNFKGEYKDEKFRTWQINQPFENMNKEVNIPDWMSEELSKHKAIKELGYTDPRITH